MGLAEGHSILGDGDRVSLSKKKNEAAAIWNEASLAGVAWALTPALTVYGHDNGSSIHSTIEQISAKTGRFLSSGRCRFA